MNTELNMRLEKLLDRKLSVEEKERLRRIQDTLHISAEDALWDILVAMEYQRNYYDELPEKISAAAAEILQGITVAAEREVAHAQSRLAESVVEQAKKLSVRISFADLLPVGLLALACLLAFGSLCCGPGTAWVPVRHSPRHGCCKCLWGLSSGSCAAVVFFWVFWRQGILPKAAGIGVNAFLWRSAAWWRGGGFSVLRYFDSETA